MKLPRKRTLIEWGVILLLVVVIQTTGLGTPMAAMLQRMMLATGLFAPQIIQDQKDQALASYDFRLKNPRGEVIEFSRFQGEVVFLNFWASWCPPCIAEMPSIVAIHQKLKDKGVKFVLVSLDQDEAKAHAFMKKKGYDLPYYFRLDPMPPAFRSQSIPFTLILSKDGRIKAKNQGMASYDTPKFEKFLLDLAKDKADS